MSLKHNPRLIDPAKARATLCKEGLVEALQALIESAVQAEYDFCGEQREWHLPRIQAIYTKMICMFPRECMEAMQRAKTPYGNLVNPNAAE